MANPWRDWAANENKILVLAGITGLKRRLPDQIDPASGVLTYSGKLHNADRSAPTKPRSAQQRQATCYPSK
jgi:hypothetical protein